jgi:RNA polymerase subunit RPABC4/transcription elongation factor Spt4/chromosome segregation ATPase
LAQKGVTRSGEAYCLQCKSYVDPTLGRCPSCGSEFAEEVKAFFCPRCESLLTLGTAECPECGMKFRVKAIRHDGSVVDLDRYPPEQTALSVAKEEADRPATHEEPAEAKGLSDAQLRQLRELVASLTALAEDRAALAAHMSQNVQNERERLESLSKIEAADPKLGEVEEEVTTLSGEMAGIMNLYSEMSSVVDDISNASETLGLSEETGRKGLAAKALRMKTESAGAGEDALRAKEEQLSKREEMVDRKIKGYAQKKKELDDKEARLVAKLERIEREQALLDDMKARVEPSESESVRENDRLEFEKEIILRLVRMESSLRGGGEVPDQGADVSVDDRLSSLESLTRRVLEEKEEADLRLKELAEAEDEVRRLLKSLDQLLGQLPESAVLQFTQSEDYKLYERVLDRLKI